MDYFGIKELYDVTLFATSDIEVNGEFLQENEPIISFDNIQISYLNEIKSRHYAQGGFKNKTLVKWEDTKFLDFSLTEGIVSDTGLLLLSNSKVFKYKKEPIIIPYNEIVESEIGEDKEILYLRHPAEKIVLIKKDGEVIRDYQVEEENSTIILLSKNHLEPTKYLVYYDYKYEDSFSSLNIGQRCFRGFLKLCGRARVKGEKDGKEATLLIEFPKVELKSDLSISLGAKASPNIFNFDLRAHPVGEQGSQYLGSFIRLDRDIDADI